MWLKMRFGEERKPRTTFHQGTCEQISPSQADSKEPNIIVDALGAQ